LVRVLNGPRQPLDHVLVERSVARANHHPDVLFKLAPVALLWFDTPTAPEIVLSIDDRLPTGLKRHASVLSPVGMFEPPATKVDPLRFFFVTDVDASVEVEIAQILEP